MSRSTTDPALRFLNYTPTRLSGSLSRAELEGGPVKNYEVPLGSTLGRDELFGAFCDVRGVTMDMVKRKEYVVSPRPGMIADMKIAAVRAITASGRLGVLECVWTGTHMGIDGRPNTPMSANLVIIMRFDAQDKIELHHDYLLWNERFNDVVRRA